MKITVKTKTDDELSFELVENPSGEEDWVKVGEIGLIKLIDLCAIAEALNSVCPQVLKL